MRLLTAKESTSRTRFEHADFTDDSNETLISGPWLKQTRYMKRLKSANKIDCASFDDMLKAAMLLARKQIHLSFGLPASPIERARIGANTAVRFGCRPVAN